MRTKKPVRLVLHTIRETIQTHRAFCELKPRPDDCIVNRVKLGKQSFEIFDADRHLAPPDPSLCQPLADRKRQDPQRSQHPSPKAKDRRAPYSLPEKAKPSL